LYESIITEAGLEGDEPFTLEYSWAQKVSGAWPIQSEQINVAAESDLSQKQIVLSRFWEWEFTQYDASRGSRPPASDSYVVSFQDNGNVKVTASCGTKAGKYTIRGRSISIEMKRLRWFSCRKDENLHVFMGDLQRSNEFFIVDGQLQITMTTDSGILYFKER
jgi:hypothetical protein